MSTRPSECRRPPAAASNTRSPKILGTGRRPEYDAELLWRNRDPRAAPSKQIFVRDEPGRLTAQFLGVWVRLR
jgi:hypothetical protein